MDFIGWASLQLYVYITVTENISTGRHKRIQTQKDKQNTEIKVNRQTDRQVCTILLAENRKSTRRQKVSRQTENPNRSKKQRDRPNQAEEHSECELQGLMIK